MIRIILLDDHALIRRGLRETLSEETDFRIVGEAGDYGELRELMRTVECDVLLLDMNLPGRSGLDVLKVLADEGSPARCLVVSMYPEDQYALRALKAGRIGLREQVGRNQHSDSGGPNGGHGEKVHNS